VKVIATVIEEAAGGIGGKDAHSVRCGGSAGLSSYRTMRRNRGGSSPGWSLWRCRSQRSIWGVGLRVGWIAGSVEAKLAWGGLTGLEPRPA
jgi:hypothetical protein